MPQYLSPGVYVNEVEAGSRPIEGVGTAIAAFVGVAAKGPVSAPTLIANWGQFIDTFGDYVPDSYLAHAVYGYFNNGGGACYVVRIAEDGGPQPARAQLASASQPGIGTYAVTAVEAGPTGGQIAVEVSEPSEDAGETDTFNVVVKREGKVEETFEKVTTKKTKHNVAAVVNSQSALIRLEEIATGANVERRPAPGAVQLSEDVAKSPARITPAHYIGDADERSGLGALDAVDDVTMVCAPDMLADYERGALDDQGLNAAQLAMIDHCERMGDRMAIIDPPRDLSPQKIGTWRKKAGFASKFATLYWPWIKVFDPSQGKSIWIPPSGHMAGIWGRSDDDRGVHKAPANEVVRGALDLETQITRAEHDLLNPLGVNCLRSFNGRGIRVWGARTLSDDASWRYVNVRRLFNWVEESLIEGLQWVVFEPNDLDLWQRIRRTCNAFLLGVWRDGALFGTTPEQAFYVKCDAETNPPDAVDRGEVNVEIGLAPVKPAEFVVFSIAQYSGGAQVSE